MILLLVKSYKGYKLYCPEVYGLETWGMNHQESLIKENNQWYFNSWTSGGDYFDDIEEQVELEVTLETIDIDKVLIYLNKHKCNKSIINKILDDYEQIVKDKIMLERCIYFDDGCI